MTLVYIMIFEDGFNSVTTGGLNIIAWWKFKCFKNGLLHLEGQRSFDISVKQIDLVLNTDIIFNASLNIYFRLL